MVNGKVQSNLLSSNDVYSELGTLPKPERRNRNTHNIWCSDEIDLARNSSTTQWHAWIIQIGLWILVIVAGFTMIPKLMLISSSKDEIKKHHLSAQSFLVKLENFQNQYHDEKKVPIRMKSAFLVADEKRDTRKTEQQIVIETPNKENEHLMKNAVESRETKSGKQKNPEGSIMPLEAIGITPSIASPIIPPTIQAEKTDGKAINQAKLRNESSKKLENKSSVNCSDAVQAMHLC